MCQFCETPNLPAIPGQEGEETFGAGLMADIMDRIRDLRSRAQQCIDTEGRCATHNRVSGVWEDYGTWEMEVGYNMASTYSGDTAVQTFLTPDGEYATVLAMLSSDTDAIDEVLNHPQDKEVIYHPEEITDWSEIVQRHHLIAADFRQRVSAGDTLKAKLDGRIYD